MKKKKILAALLSAVLLLIPLAPSAHAASSFLSDLLENSGLIDIFTDLLGGNTPGGNARLSDLFNNPNGVLDTIRQRIGTAVDDQTLIEAISQLLGNTGQSFNLEDLLSNDFLNRLRKYLGMAEVEESTTAEPTTEAPVTTPPTQAPTTPPTVYYYYIPSTAAPTAPPTTVYSGAQPYSVPSTLPTDETYSYVQPSVVSVPELTTQPLFTANVQDTDSGLPDESGSSVKTVIGIVILVLSLVAVVVVAVILRKSKA